MGIGVGIWMGGTVVVGLALGGGVGLKDSFWWRIVSGRLGLRVFFSFCESRGVCCEA